MRKDILLFTFLLTITTSSYSQSSALTEGHSSPTSYAVEAISGSSVTWSGLENLAASNNMYASTPSIAVNGDYSDYIVITNFGFNLPSSAVIDGIKVKVERNGSNGKCKDYSVRIVKGGVITGSDKAHLDSWSTTDEIRTYGGELDLWGEVWTREDINASSFGIAIAVKRSGAGGATSEAFLDNIEIVIHYEAILEEKLVSFNAAQKEAFIVSDWEVANSAAQYSFFLERAGSSLEFQEIAFESSSTGKVNYQYEDYTPLAGSNYYRLKMVATDGEVTYSKVKEVNWTGSQQVSNLYPNPVHRGANVNMTVPQTVSEIQIYTSTGKLVSLIENRSNLVELPTTDLDRGIYFVKLVDPTNSSDIHHKMVVLE